jgi:hypothetical protein
MKSSNLRTPYFPVKLNRKEDDVEDYVADFLNTIFIFLYYNRNSVVKSC